MTEPRSVLVFRFSSVGDIVLTAPALEALRKAWPGARIHYAVKQRFGALLRHNPNIDEVVELGESESLFAFARRLRRLECDAVLDLDGKPRSAILRALVRAPGPFAGWSHRPVLDYIGVHLLRMKPYRAQMPIADRYHRCVERLVGRTLPRGQLHHWVGAADVQEASASLCTVGVDLSRPIVGIAPGSMWETKRWPVERFAELARRVHARGFQVVLTGSASEIALAGKLQQLAPVAVDVSGKLSLGALGGMLSLCTAFLANDSGPLHMARAMGVPTLTFFGSTDPAQFELEGHALLFAGIECSPCSFYGLRRCPQGHFRCMLDLDVERAWHALEPLLHGRRVGVVHA